MQARKKLFNAFAMHVAAVMLAACSSAHSGQDARQWDKRLATELPLGSARADAERWAKANEFTIIKNDNPNQMSLWKETSGDGIVCSKWRVVVKLSFDMAGKLERRTSDEVGTCL